MTVELGITYVTPDDYTSLIHMGTGGRSPEEVMRENGPPPVLEKLYSQASAYCGPDWLKAFQTQAASGDEYGLGDTIRILSLVDLRCVNGAELTTTYESTRVAVGRAMMRGAQSPYTPAGRVFSGGNLTAIHAFAHSIFGKGEAVTYPIEKIGMNIDVNGLQAFKDTVKNSGVGSTPVDFRFTRDTMMDGVVPGLTLGNITLRTVGVITKNANGSWTFDGVVRAFDDIYDANPSTHRSLTGEALTSFLSQLSRQSYTVEIPGEIPISTSGFVSH